MKHTIALGLVAASLLVATLWMTNETSSLAVLTAFLAGAYGTRFVASAREGLVVKPGRISPEAEEYLVRRYDTISKKAAP